MSVWILIAVFNWGYGSAATSVTFQNQASCESAASIVNGKTPVSSSATWVVRDWAVCVEDIQVKK